MNNPNQTAVIEPERDASVELSEPERDEALAAEALEGIQGAEKVSGLGRFATRMQNLFQSSRPSQPRSSGHLRLAPIMMGVGLLLLIATSFLFLLSKPESTVPSRFRQPTGLSGPEDQKRGNTGVASAPSDVTENQLVGGDPSTDPRRTHDATRRLNDPSARRFSGFDDQPGGGSPSGAAAQPAANELQTPATVFTAAVPPISVQSVRSSAQDAQAQLQLPSGTEIVAHTTNAISSGLESPVVAVVDRNVELDDAVIIPQGSRVIGYTAGAVKDRINVRFTSLLLPNHREIAISGLALMRDGSAGLVGRVQGSGHPILASAGRVATGTAVLATQFVGQNSLNQPFSQADYLRNQMAAEIASEGSRFSNKLQQPVNVPIVTVNTNQSIRIFLLNAMSVSDKRARNSMPAQQAESPTVAEQNLPPDQALAAAQTAYIQALEAQLADMRAALDGRKPNGRR